MSKAIVGPHPACDCIAQQTLHEKTCAVYRSEPEQNAAYHDDACKCGCNSDDLAPAAAPDGVTPTHWLIYFDDAERRPEIFTNEQAAWRRYDQVSIMGNAHLREFAKADSNSRDVCQSSPAPDGVTPITCQIYGHQIGVKYCGECNVHPEPDGVTLKFKISDLPKQRPHIPDNWPGKDLCKENDRLAKRVEELERERDEWKAKKSEIGQAMLAQRQDLSQRADTAERELAEEKMAHRRTLTDLHGCAIEFRAAQEELSRYRDAKIPPPPTLGVSANDPDATSPGYEYPQINLVPKKDYDDLRAYAARMQVEHDTAVAETIERCAKAIESPAVKIYPMHGYNTKAGLAAGIRALKGAT